jgi:hypothetical protein
MEYQGDVQTPHAESGNKERQSLYVPEDSVCDYDNSFSGSEHAKEQASDSPPVSRSDSSSLGISAVTTQKYNFADFREVAPFDRSCSSADVSERVYRRNIERQMSDIPNLTSRPDSITEQTSGSFVKNRKLAPGQRVSRGSIGSVHSTSLLTADVDDFDSHSSQQFQALSNSIRVRQEDRSSASVASNLHCVTVTSNSDRQQHFIPSASASGGRASLGGGLLPSGRPDVAVLYSCSSGHRPAVGSKFSSLTGLVDTDCKSHEAVRNANENSYPVQDLLDAKGTFFDSVNLANMMNTEDAEACRKGTDASRFNLRLHEDPKALFDYLSDAFGKLDEMMNRVCISHLMSIFVLNGNSFCKIFSLKVHFT